MVVLDAGLSGGKASVHLVLALFAALDDWNGRGAAVHAPIIYPSVDSVKAPYAVKASDAIEHIAAVKSIVPAPLKAAVDVMEDGFTEQPTGDPEPESLADHSQRVLAEVKAWVERVSERSDFRAKSGRELSRANVEALRTAYRLIGELLERNDKPLRRF